MNCLIVSCVYPPEPVISGQTSLQIAEALAAKGHQVSILTPFPNRPSGRLYVGYKRKLYQQEQVAERISLTRCFSFLSSESRLLSRLLENFSFGIIAGIKALTMRRPDVIYANTWPIIATGIIFVVAKLRSIPLVISVQDVYPEALLVQQRVIGSKAILIRFVRWIDGVIARGSAHVVVISSRFAEIYSSDRRVQVKCLSLIPNWIDSGKFVFDRNCSTRYRETKGIPRDAVVCVYAGNIGVAAGVESLIDAFLQLQDIENLYLIVAGEGSQLKICQEMASSRVGSRIIFHSPYTLSENAMVLGSADVLLLPTHKQQAHVSVPSKLLSYMLAGRPILATSAPNSDLADLIENAKCGWVIEPNQLDILIETIKHIMLMSPDELTQYGERGRKFVLEHFVKDICLPKVIQIIENVK